MQNIDKHRINNDEKALLWIDNYDFMTYKKKDKFLDLFSSPSEVLEQGKLLKNKDKILTFLSQDEFDILSSQIIEKTLDEIFNKLERLNINFITCFSNNYPITLNNIDTPPYVIYYKGNLNLLNTNCFAVVGSRHITSYGKMATEKFTIDLVKAGFTIVSGLASGVDTVAHSVSLDNKGNTIAVLAGGLDDIYPSTNINLAKRIIENNGLIISETRPGKKTDAYMFPIRNRIIAGLSKGVLITEAQEKSGVIHTKNYAIEYGKDVFAVPGSIFSSSSAGSNRMIVNGQAKAVINSDDILDEYNISLEKVMKTNHNYSIEESIIISCLEKGEKTFQELIVATKYEVKRLNSLLTTLLIRGIIRKLAGNIYYLNS